MISVAITLIMFGIGSNITVNDFKRVFLNPKAILVGLALQMILLPMTGFLIAFLWPIAPLYKVGLVLIAACPGGTASNLVTHLSDGRVALSISLTAFNSFLILISIPLIMSFSSMFFLGQSADVSLSFLNILKEISATVVLPVGVGMTIRHFFPQFSKRLRKPMKYILPAILIAVFFYVLFDQQSGGSRISWSDWHLVLPTLLLNISTIFAGFMIAGLTGINHKGKYTIAIEMGLQNSALAIFIAEQLLDNSAVSAIAVIYSSFSFFTTWGIAYLMKKHFDKVSGTRGRFSTLFN